MGDCDDRTGDFAIQHSRLACAAPSAMTFGSVLLGFLAIMATVHAASSPGGADATGHLRLAALAIGLAVVLDQFDGRLARGLGTTSAFGKELDSLADVISFGVAPAALVVVWGAHFIETGSTSAQVAVVVVYASAATFLLCGTYRLARFNVGERLPSVPGRSERGYSVGFTVPAAAAVLAAVVHVFAEPVEEASGALALSALVVALSFLMVSAWRYRTFKELRPRSLVTPLRMAGLAAGIGVLAVTRDVGFLGLTAGYAASGIVARLADFVHPPAVAAPAVATPAAVPASSSH